MMNNSRRQLKMKLPALIECRNITYQEALRQELEETETWLHRTSGAQKAFRDRIKQVKDEIKRWGF